MAERSGEEAGSVAESLGSVTLMYQRVVDGDTRAPGELWEAYSKRLFGLARAVLRERGITPAQVSEDSIVNVAFAKFFDALARGHYHEVADRHELWCLLAVITRNRALTQAQRAGKRAVFSADAESALYQQCDAEPTADEVAAFSDTIAALEQQIRSRSTSEDQADRILRVLSMSLCGYAQREIADAIGQTEVTVRRNLGIIRNLLSRSRDIRDD